MRVSGSPPVLSAPPLLLLPSWPPVLGPAELVESATPVDSDAAVPDELSVPDVPSPSPDELDEHPINNEHITM